MVSEFCKFFYYFAVKAVLKQPDDGQFVYALLRNRNDIRARYNPYDLEVVSPHLARKENLYFTGSASNVTRVGVFVLLVCPIIFLTPLNPQHTYTK